MAVTYRALQMFTKVNSKLSYRRQALLVSLNHQGFTKLSSNTFPSPQYSFHEQCSDSASDNCYKANSKLFIW